jgi:hypothetical protein
MKVISLFFVLLFTQSGFACNLKPGADYLSFSGPVSFLLRELGLLDDSNLKAISTFHKIGKKYKVKRAGGGIFLSRKFLESFKKPIVFFDESEETRKNLRSIHIESKEVKTRSMDPFEAYIESLGKLQPYLVNCGGKVQALTDKALDIKMKLLEKKKFQNKMIFYLGKLNKEGRKPNLLIGNDIFVKFWVKKEKLKTFNSTLQYIPWSANEMNSFSDVDTLHFGVIDDHGEFVTKVKNNHYNLTYPGGLVPGISQIYFMEKFAKKFN